MMVKCLHCKGEKGGNRLVTEIWVEPPEYKWVQCRTCEGTGEFTELKAAVYRARGGPAPVKLRGFA